MKEIVRLDANLTIISVFLLTFLLQTNAFGQGLKEVSLSGQIRSRSEYSGKDFNSDRDNITFHLLRTRLNVAARPAEDLRTFVQIQDSRVFGSETNTLSDGSADAIDVHQAYFQVDNFFDSELTVRLGRQEINVGNQRLVGAVGWDNIGRSFDGLRMFYDLEGGSLQFFAARLVGSSGVAEGKNLYGAEGTFPLSDGHKLSVLALLDNDTAEIETGPSEGEHRLSRYTVGATANGASRNFDYELEAFFQGGNQERGANERASIRGSLLSAKAGLLVSEEKNIRIGGLVTLVSGDKDAADNERRAFNTLFATNHRFYGFMDYFVSFGSPAGIGLRDYSLSLALNPSEALRVKVDIHQFMADQVPAGADDEFGQEVDVTGVFKYNEAFSFTIGASAFTPGDLMKSSRGDDTAFWAYLMTVVNL
ncbi:MAG: hypothetical protein BMS9Abin05_1311 [Rhodothermia bacterium]|nr:MAG: hypothetical protein BMS9Abin05_1311 [Rhodothermia bacterium]